MRERASGLFFLCFSIFVMWESQRLGLGTSHRPGTGFLSFYAGAILAGLSLTLCWRGWRIQESQKASYSRRVVLALVSLIVYSLVLDALGFIVATFFLVGIFFHLGEPRRWWVLLGMSASVAFLVYLVFGILLQVYLPRGFLGI